MAENQAVAESVNAEQLTNHLTEFVDSRIRENQKSPEELADELSEHLDQGVSEEDVQRMIEEADIGGGGGGGSNEDVSTEVRNVRLTNSPTHTTSIDTGVPQGEMHPYGDWGVIVTVEEPVHWRSTVIVPAEAGKTNLQIYSMNYSEGETYEPTGIHATREITHSSGQQTVYPDVILPEGQFFICRDPDQTVPMREIMTDVNWNDFNQHNVPIEVECSWRINADYRPGTDGFQKYKNRGWDQLYYYFGNPKFGFQGE